MSHSFLFKILREYGIGDNFCSRLKQIYADATSTLTLNGHKSKPVRIMCRVRQGCPLSMLLFALCINPLLINLDKKLSGVYIRRNSTKTTAIAYVDDITTVITQPEHHSGDITRLYTSYWSMHQYKQITGHCPWKLEQINAHNGHYIPRRN